MKLIDTSCWVHALRPKGTAEIRERVAHLVTTGNAAWCAPVRLELWAGVGRDPEAQVLRQFENVLPDYAVTHAVWAEAQKLAGRGRREGLSAPSMDILVAACARHHGLEVEHDDTDFDWLMRV